MSDLTKKEKIKLVRIIIVLAAFIGLMIAERTGTLKNLPSAAIFPMYLVPYLIIGYDVIARAWKNIVHGQVFDENFLMMLATFAAFALGISGSGSYDEALAVMLFYQIGELFQDYAVGKSRKSISEMMSIAPEYANLERDGRVEQADPEDVHPNDIIVIKPGEKIPLDGVVLDGASFLDTAALTGESVPRRAAAGDAVISGCVNGEGTLRVRVTREYEDSTVAKILDLVENSSSRKARLENFITRFARYYTPIVTVGAVVLAIVPPLFGWMPWSSSVRRACNFLIVSCPCALVISVPLGFFGGIGAASKIGVLVKGSNYLEAAAGMTTVVMDKTGTLTKGEFKVQKVLPANGFTKEELLEMAAYGEALSTHPIAQSIRTAYGKNPDSSRLSDSSETAGHGVKIRLDGRQLMIGNSKLMESAHVAYAECKENGTIVYVSLDGKFAGAIVISDTVKEGAADAVAAMKKAGIRRTVMLTGDRKSTADAVASGLGIDEVHAELLPGDKVGCVEKLLGELSGTKNKLGFVGDGINDAPVLMRADVGIAMGSLGSDAAIEAADIVLMDDDIAKIPAIIRIARKTLRIVKSNVFFAITVKLLILLLSVFGLASMWAAVFADVGVAVICILNSMRALKVR
jgi:Cd2+/Zn2+-exporting ATPase